MVDIITKLDRIQLIEHYYTNIFDFAQDFLPHWLTTKTPKFHFEIYKLLLSEPMLAVSAPRGYAKSTVCAKIFPLWAGCFKFLGNVSIISASEDFVIREITSPIRIEYESNAKLQKIFGKFKTEQWSASYFRLQNGIAFEGCGVNGQLRGGRRGIVVLDDIESNDSVLSEDQRNKIEGKINKEIIPKLLPESRCVFIGTIIHPLAYLNQILTKKDNGWTKREYRAYKNTKHGDAKGQRKGNELWSEMWNHEKLQQRKKAIGTYAFASEYLNDPVSDGSNPINPNNIKYWDSLPDQMSLYINLDPAYRDDDKGDYKVAVVVGVDVHGNRYLVEYLRTRSPLGEYMEGIINLYVKHRERCVKFGCPRGREIDFWNSIHEKARQRGVFLPSQEVTYIIRDAQTGKATRNKNERIVRTLQPHFEQGKYYIHSTHKDAETELLTFQNSSAHDDLVDALSGCEQLIEPHYSFQTVEQMAKDVFTDPFEEDEDLGETGYGDY